MRPMIELIFGQRMFPYSLKRTGTMCQRLLNQNLMAAVNPRRRSPIFPLSPKNRPRSVRRFWSITNHPTHWSTMWPVAVSSRWRHSPPHLWREAAPIKSPITGGRSMSNIGLRTMAWKQPAAVISLWHFPLTWTSAVIL